MDNSKLTSMFVSSDERCVAILGSNAAETFFSSGTLGNGFAVLSNKRVYFRGRCLIRTGKRISAQKEERVVDVQNITGTGFVYNNPVGLLVCAIACLVISLLIISGAGVYTIPLIVVGIIFFFLYRSRKRTLFEISFAGGGIAFNVSWFPAEEAQFFQKNIKLVGDALKAQEKQHEKHFGTASELEKLAQLLAQGLITQEEYEAQKRTLLN